MSDSGEVKTPPRVSQSSEVESKSQEEMTKNSKKRSLEESSDTESWLENRRKLTGKPTRRNIESEYEKTEENQLKKVEEEEDDDTLPLTCSICNKPFLDPVVTKCQHYFCEYCALKHEKENNQCFVCNEPTLGVFNEAVELKKKIAKAMVKEVSTRVEKASEMVNDAGGIAEKAVKLVEEVEKMVGNAAELASKAGKMAAEAAEMVQEAEATMETAKADMAKAFEVMGDF